MELGRRRELLPKRWEWVELMTYDSCSRPSHSIRQQTPVTVQDTESENVLALYANLN